MNHLETLKYIRETNQERVYFYNNSYIIFNGFILSLSGIFLGFADISCINKTLFIISIISITIGYYLFFKIESSLLKNFHNLYDIYKNGIDENKDSIEGDLEKNQNISNIIKILSKFLFLIDIGILTFIIGIISLAF